MMSTPIYLINQTRESKYKHVLLLNVAYEFSMTSQAIHMTLSSDREQQKRISGSNPSIIFSPKFNTSHALTILEAQQIAASSAPSASVH